MRSCKRLTTLPLNIALDAELATLFNIKGFILLQPEPSIRRLRHSLESGALRKIYLQGE